MRDGPGMLASPVPAPSPTTTLRLDTNQAVTSASKLILHSYHVALIVVVAFGLKVVTSRSIARFARSIASGRLNRGLSRLDTLSEGESVERRTQRAATLGSVLRSIANAVIFTIAAILVLGELGLNLAPILASAGIVGVALGFGAQSVVKDFLAGVFLVLEDQYGVGDVIDLQKDMGITGTVESISLRSSRVRDVRGNLWHIRNGNINQVGNISQGWSRILLDVVFDLGVDVTAAREAMLVAATRYATAPEHVGDVLEDPAVWGVEDVNPAGVTLRLAVKTQSAVKDDVARGLREALLAQLAAGGIELAGGGQPVQVTHVQASHGSSSPVAPFGVIAAASPGSASPAGEAVPAGTGGEAAPPGPTAGEAAPAGTADAGSPLQDDDAAGEAAPAGTGGEAAPPGPTGGESAAVGRAAGEAAHPSRPARPRRGRAT